MIGLFDPHWTIGLLFGGIVAVWVWVMANP
jgi:hypothetical protein